MKTRINKVSLQGFKSFRKRVSVPFFPGFVVFCGPNGVGKSVRGDTQILLSNGNFKPIREIVENGLEKSGTIHEMGDGYYTLENSDDVKVLGLDPETMRIREKEVASFVKREGEKTLIRIRTRSGKEITTTKCHPVMVFKNGKIRPINVGELKECELIATPRKLDISPIENEIKLSKKFNFQEKKDYYLLHKNSPNCKDVIIPKKIDVKFARSLGYLIGDGYIKKGSRCEFTNSNEKLIKDFIQTSRKFGTGFKLYEYRKGLKIVKIYSSLLSRFITDLFDGKIRSGNKQIPREILFSEKRILSNFLAALFECDGYIAKDHPSFEFSTKSETLARQVQFSLLRFGIYSVLKKKKKHATNTKERKEEVYYSVCVDGIKDLRTMYENIRFLTKEKIKRLERQVFKPVESQTNVDIFPREVNERIHRLALMLEVKIKKKRKKFPRFAAYCENRCYPTRDGIEEAIIILDRKINEIKRLKNDLSPSQDTLLKILDELPITRKEASKAIGFHEDSITNSWVRRGSKAKTKNIRNLYKFLKEKIIEILETTQEEIKLLKKLVHSEILWDEIIEIEEVPGKGWVYDLCIPNCHNFIGNLIFVHNSNILDAISFALGSTSTKSLRAGRLHELIYHGNGNVPPSEYASVTLWLDNSDGVFPYETPEVAIKRKINKKGVSVFKINGRTTTREKVLEVLSPTRIHPDGYNLIMQGDVSQVVEMGPQERRGIIDEISGIAHYNEKREKAQKNLEKVGEKLKEIEIILTERLGRLQDLEKDRNTALKYKELREKLERLEASLAYKKFQLEKEKFDGMEKKIKESEEEIQELEDSAIELEKEIEKKEKRREEITEIIFVRSKEAGIREEIEDIKNKMLRDKDKIESDKREIERLDKMIERLEKLQKKPQFFRKGVRAVLNLKKNDVYGTISDLINVPKDYRTAIEVAGGYRLQNLVVKSTKTAIDCINYLKKNKIGRATFLPMNKIRPIKSKGLKKLIEKPGVVGLITDLLHFKKEFSPAIEYIFGNTIVVENLGVARRVGIGNVRMVTLDGDLVERSGAMIGGFYKKREEMVGGAGLDIEEYERNKKELQEELNFLNIEIKQLEEKLKDLKKSKEVESKEVLDLDEERTEIDEELEKMREERKEMLEKRISLQTKMNRLKIDSAKKEAELKNLELELEKYEDIEYIDEKPKILEFEIQRTTGTLNTLGLVNLKAIEEYDAFKGEFDELKHKYDKIRDERQAILDMIEKIEGKRKEVFYGCLKAIDKNFRKVFRNIAKGKASLELEDPLDIESGLLIQANPAGKSLLNIDAMSGGEKALTALAFLFAVQMYKPAPFYVLDEIDAFLDKVNTKRVVDMIKKLSVEEQFIIITHNDYTIKQGDRVYGVSMESGESKILGLELPKGEAG